MLIFGSIILQSKAAAAISSMLLMAVATTFNDFSCPTQMSYRFFHFATSHRPRLMSPNREVLLKKYAAEEYAQRLQLIFITMKAAKLYACHMISRNTRISRRGSCQHDTRPYSLDDSSLTDIRERVLTEAVCAPPPLIIPFASQLRYFPVCGSPCTACRAIQPMKIATLIYSSTRYPGMPTPASVRIPV